jgi:8-oxo-dGTP pyrophosphatase MutT (NUDIX family)
MQIPYTPTLLFLVVPSVDLRRIEREGLVSTDSGEDFVLSDAFPDQIGPTEVALAVDTAELSLAEPADGYLKTREIPRKAIVNIEPYLPLREVTAAGGMIVRRGDEDLEVVLIKRKGKWDLPKGKLDEDETVVECARREVCEELGIDSLSVLSDLGRTVHGYDEEEFYRVKTVHWFAMTTDASTFSPQASEDIDEVVWVPWFKALERIGYLSLRLHMLKVTSILDRL